MHQSKSRWAILTLAILCLLQMGTAKNMFWRRACMLWVNGSSDEKITETIQMMDRAHKAGYNMYYMDDSRFPIISKLGQRTLDRYKRLGAKSEQLKVPIVPMSFGQLDASRRDVVHGEAYPTKGTPFKVSGNEARAYMDPVISLPNVGFEKWSGNTPNAWEPRNCTLGTHVFQDTETKKSGNASLRFEIPKIRKVALFTSGIKLQPFRAYRLSVWIKTRDVTNPRTLGFEVWGDNMWLLKLRDRRGVTASTSDWKRYSWNFNSLHANVATVRLTVSGFHITTGTAWFDDITIEEIGLEMTQTRSTTPVIVKSESGTVFAAGKDYSVGKGKLGIPAGSAIKNGQVLKVDWYQISQTETYTPPAAFCTPEVWTVYQNNAKLLNQNVCNGQVQGFLLKPSEWRIAFWDPACMAQYKNAGQYMGAVQKKLAETVFAATGGTLKEVHLYNDCYDPYHNARLNYPYPVNQINGGKIGSWNGLHCRTVINNWNVNHRKESLYFYAGKDPQYPSEKRPQLLAAANAWVESWLEALDDFEKDYPGEDDVAVGVGFGTYTNSWEGIEALADKCKPSGRWASNEDPFTGFEWPKECSVGIGTAAEKATTRGPAVSMLLRQSKIEYRISLNAMVNASLVDLSGRTIRVIEAGIRSAGKHTIDLEQFNVAGGVYFIKLRSKLANGTEYHAAKKAVLL